jgi:Zn finger protein HypA/HybF involved in hydrogenase expression
MKLLVCTECKQMSNQNVKISKNKMCPECEKTRLRTDKDRMK